MDVEFTLHRQLKDYFSSLSGTGGLLEVRQGPFRADALTSDGAWIEIQNGPLAPLRKKLSHLLPLRPVVVVKPIIVERRILHATRRGAGSTSTSTSSRLSPRRGSLTDAFEDLVSLAHLFPHPNLTIELLAVAIDEHRSPRRRRPGFAVADRSLRDIRQSLLLRTAKDLWSLLPQSQFPEPFSTREISLVLNRDINFAQKVAYTLRHSGAASPCGKIGNRILYHQHGPHLQIT